MAETSINFNQTDLIAIMADPTVGMMMVEMVQPQVRLAQILAPKRTGRGAESIRAEAVLDGDQWEVHSSWTQERYYMYFHEKGTRYMLPHPFLEPAFEF